MIDWQIRQFWPFSFSFHLATFSLASILAAAWSVAATLNDFERAIEQPQQSQKIVVFALRIFMGIGSGGEANAGGPHGADRPRPSL